MGKREKDGSKSSCAYTQTIVRLYANDCATIRDLKHFKTTEFCCLLTLSSCFNPRPYERGDRRPHIAPRSEVCFNPRPYERGDNHSGENIPNVLQFQSTPLREGRPFLLRLRCVGAGVSIHAPTRGATPTADSMRASTTCFNPRPYERGDRHHLSGCLSFFCFNPRPYERGDHHFLGEQGRQTGFNPRPYERGDIFYLQRFIHHDVSIHAPTRGATQRGTEAVHPGTVSIHAPTRGATLHRLSRHTEAQVSIHAPTRGATKRIHYLSELVNSFNPRPYERGDI